MFLFDTYKVLYSFIPEVVVGGAVVVVGTALWWWLHLSPVQQWTPNEISPCLFPNTLAVVPNLEQTYIDI